MSTSNYYQLSVPVNNSDHMQGSMDAPLILLEYGDYQCPYCGQAYPIVKQIQSDFGDQLAFVFRNFPLSQMHAHAFHAAEAAEIAADEGKFWEMHDIMFENQDQLDDLGLAKMADRIGLDPKQFLVNLESNSKKDKVQSDFMSGVESGVNGTPSFYINGAKYNGSWDYATFSNVLKSML